ncbi:hypothetical protein P22_0604 [Propionispora sp. 2/2-37]|uniref:hypothetical protein n=1 Tax=Propionispora sp. 2/2-37 TaxID=1677858 RepID=UPI0006C3C2C7|nr:hypothetical protein [Propionispora sp. 2/2-37]CUH94538.1 hypothetical protein P22_0604 [Propionispora sp. 2/2-37]
MSVTGTETVKTVKRIGQRLFTDTFNRDIIVLLVVSIVIGSLLSSTLSLSANAYFSKTLSSMVGDYGEYDLIIQAREEMKQDTATQIQNIIADVFPGATLKEGPTITGKTNFFIALPPEYRTKEVYDNLGKTFGGIPGGAGVGVMTEPRLTIRGVPEGARNKLIEQIGGIPGVNFAFHDGSSVGVILSSLEQSAAVNEQIKALLQQYQVIEISFPVGSEPDNPIRLGETIAAEMKEKLQATEAENVSVDGKNDNMTYTVSTMMELKRFLKAYASEVTIAVNEGTRLLQGDMVAFQGTAQTPPATGGPVDPANVLVEVTEVETGGTVKGMIVQGDASALLNPEGYKVSNSIVGNAVGKASYRNPRQELGQALNETTKLVEQVPEFAENSRNLAQISLRALDNYDNSVDAMEKTLDSLQSAGGTIQTVTGNLAGLDTKGIRTQVDNSSQALSRISTGLQVVQLINPEVKDTVNAIDGAQQNLTGLSETLGALETVSDQAKQVQGLINTITVSGQDSIANLRSFDVQGAKQNLAGASEQLDKLNHINVPLVTAQLQYMAQAVPALKDEEIGRSVKLLDNFIDGQVIPGERIQILTSRNIGTEAVAPLVEAQVGHSNASLYSSDLGVIEPDTRGQVYKVLNEVRAILAGLMAMIATLVFLALDHTAVMAVMRRKRLAVKTTHSGWRGVVYRVMITFTAVERRYGMAVGAVMLTAMFILADGGIPYLPWLGVPVIGALLGLIAAGYAEKINPVSTEEVMAGEAMGLSFDEIMREIVVPGGRPGLMQKLNRRKIKFK